MWISSYSPEEDFWDMSNLSMLEYYRDLHEWGYPKDRRLKDHLRKALEKKWINVKDFESTLRHMNLVFWWDNTEKRACFSEKVPLHELQKILRIPNDTKWAVSYNTQRVTTLLDNGTYIRGTQENTFDRNEAKETFDIVWPEGVTHAFSFDHLKAAAKEQIEWFKSELEDFIIDNLENHPEGKLWRFQISIPGMKYDTTWGMWWYDWYNTSPISDLSTNEEWIEGLIVEIWFYVLDVYKDPTLQSNYVRIPLADIKNLATKSEKIN